MTTLRLRKLTVFIISQVPLTIYDDLVIISFIIQTAAYKGSGKRTYAERARELGLEPAALEVMQGTHNKFVSTFTVFLL